MIVGIDLGTTNSLVACCKNGIPEVISLKDGQTLLPSVVHFDKTHWIVGNEAKRYRTTDPTQTIFSIKRLIGKSTQEALALQKELPYKIVAPVDPANKVPEIEVSGGRHYSPVEISAMILSELKKAATEALGSDVSQAVITVPAYFNDNQRQATRLAGRLAGWDVLRIVNEPTAASLAYGLDKKKQGLIAVFDLGGGTFDISILRLQDGVFEVLSTHGDTQLGGDDIDRILAAYMDPHWRDLDSEDLAALYSKAEAIKKQFSTQESVSFEYKNKPCSLSRQEFSNLLGSFLNQIKGPCMQALSDSGHSRDELTDVVMVGGPTRLPVIQDLAKEIFGRIPNCSMHPDQVVALGAAIQADILAGNNRDMLLLDVVPLTLGLETYGGLMSPIIQRNSRIPTVVKEMYTTHVDNQTAVDLHVLQGERDAASDCRSLARFKLRIEPLPAGVPRVEVSFMIDADGILQVSAKDQRTGRLESIEVRPSAGMTDSQIEAMLLAGLDHAEADFAFRKYASAKMEAQKVLDYTSRNLPLAKDLVSRGKLTEQELAKINGCVHILGSMLLHTSGDAESLRKATFELDSATRHLAELIVVENLA